MTTRLDSRPWRFWRQAALGGGFAAILFLAFWNLTAFPLTWFDEGAHVEAARMLASTGRFAGPDDASGSPQSVGPTVALPVAIVLRCCGASLRSVRLVMAAYLVATIAMWYVLARQLGTPGFAAATVALLTAETSVGLLRWGREVMGEVPGLFYLSAGLVVWFRQWACPNRRSLLLAGCLLGLSAITKPQYLLMIGGGVGLAWLANLVYFRARTDLFLAPALAAALCVVLWHVFYSWQLVDLSSSSELSSVTRASRSIGFFVSWSVTRDTIKSFVTPGSFIYGGWLVPALAYGAALTLTGDDKAQKWAILWLLAIVELGWFTFSVGWFRYAVPGLALGSLFVAACFERLTDGFSVGRLTFPIEMATARRIAILVWLGLLLAQPLKDRFDEIRHPPFNAPVAIAGYIDATVPSDAVIETFEVEVPFLTHRRYHVPPAQLQETAILHSLGKGPPPLQYYNPLQDAAPPFVLVGDWARNFKMYSPELLKTRYRMNTRIGPYELYQRIADPAPNSSSQ